jgi:rhodanese-related sulfurtransferase
MPTEIFRDEVRRLLTDGAQLVDVLPSQEYQDLHLPLASPRRRRVVDLGCSTAHNPPAYFCRDGPRFQQQRSCRA